MKAARQVFLLLLWLCGATTALARLGDTRELAEDRYGVPKNPKLFTSERPLLEGAQDLFFDLNDGWRLRCALLLARDGQWYVVREEYRKAWNAEAYKLGKSPSIQDFESEAILHAEAVSSGPWRRKLAGELGKDISSTLANQLAHIGGLSGKVWHRKGDGGIARLPMMGSSIILELPQALEHEAQLAAIKEQKLRQGAANIFQPLGGPSAATPAPAPVAAPTATPTPQPSLPPTPAPRSFPPAAPVPRAQTTDAALPLPRAELVTTRPARHASEPPTWFMFLCSGFLLLGMVTAGGLAVWFLRKLWQKGSRNNLSYGSPPPLPATWMPPTPLEPLPLPSFTASRPRTFHDLTWDEFEMLVGEVYRRQGYGVEISNATGSDGGVDLVLTKEDERVLVQCKNWKSAKVTVKELREFFGVLVSEQATRGIFVTSSSYTRDAQEFATGKPITLVDGQELAKAVKDAKHDPADDLLDVKLWAPLFAQQVKVTAPLCPSCRSGMKLREGPTGRFWGCSTFPRCRGKREVRPHLLVAELC